MLCFKEAGTPLMIELLFTQFKAVLMLTSLAMERPSLVLSLFHAKHEARDFSYLHALSWMLRMPTFVIIYLKNIQTSFLSAVPVI